MRVSVAWGGRVGGVRRRGRETAWFVVVAALAGTVGALAPLLMLDEGTKAEVWLSLVLLIAFAGVLGLVALRACQKGSGPEGRPAVGSWLRSGRCPSCRYDLRGVPVQADGCSVCPECGAAWRLDGN